VLRVFKIKNVDANYVTCFQGPAVQAGQQIGIDAGRRRSPGLQPHSKRTQRNETIQTYHDGIRGTDTVTSSGPLPSNNKAGGVGGQPHKQQSNLISYLTKIRGRDKQADG
jgi:hypothetical protein